MACHIPPHKKVKKQGEMPLPSLSPIPLKMLNLGIGCELFRAHEMRSQLEVTEMPGCKVNLTV